MLEFRTQSEIADMNTLLLTACIKIIKDAKQKDPEILVIDQHMSLVVRKPAFCIYENKDADQLRSNCAADQRLCFRYTDNTNSLLPKSKISSL